MGLAVTIVILLSSILSWITYHFILVPFKMSYLKTIVFILIIASFVQMLEMIIKKIAPSLHKSIPIKLLFIK